jgi:hypothetical protein
MSTRSSLLEKAQGRRGPLAEGARSKRGGRLPVDRRHPITEMARPAVAVSIPTGPLIPASLRHDMIRDAAYFRAQARGFEPGKDVEDWLEAEQDIEEIIVRRYGR